MGWWNWQPFDPHRFYDRDYFQSADAAKGYDDYRALEAGARATARARLRRMASLCGGSAASGRRELLEVGSGDVGEACRDGVAAPGVVVFSRVLSPWQASAATETRRASWSTRRTERLHIPPNDR